MRIFIKRYLRIDIYPSGPISAYRTYEQQVEAKRIYGDNAATPGTSNHGWGLAVDLSTETMRSAIDRVGAHFGWAKKWSDASWEWWHLKYRAGVWKQRPDPGINAKHPVARRGSGGRGQKWYVRKIQRRLRAHGFPLKNTGGEFNGNVDRNVRAFQKSKKLKPDGVVGPATWSALLKRPVVVPEKPSKPPKLPDKGKAPEKDERPSERPSDPVKPISAELIDVSMHQGNISWSKVAGDGIKGVYLKLSEGEDWRDRTTDAPRLQEIKQAKLKYGFYHFLRPKKRDAAREARWFISQAERLGGWGTLMPCVDIEVTELTAQENGEYLARFIDVLRREGGVKHVLVYASPGWWQSHVKLTERLHTQLQYSEAWVAHWNVTDPDSLRGIQGIALHQYTDSGKISGISTNVDRNRTKDFKRLWI